MKYGLSSKGPWKSGRWSKPRPFFWLSRDTSIINSGRMDGKALICYMSCVCMASDMAACATLDSVWPTVDDIIVDDTPILSLSDCIDDFGKEGGKQKAVLLVATGRRVFVNPKGGKDTSGTAFTTPLNGKRTAG